MLTSSLHCVCSFGRLEACYGEVPSRFRFFKLLEFVLVLALAADGFAALLSPGMMDPEFVFAAWETSDGLPQNSATSIQQTPDGFLWFGTFNGLVRYDGDRFVVFDEGTTPELPSSRIIELHLDQRQALWIISEFGDATVLKDGQFRPFVPLLGGRALKISNLNEEAGGTFLFNDGEGVYRVDGAEPTRLFKIDDLGFGRVVRMCVDRDGVIWLALKHAFGFWADGAFTPLLQGSGQFPPVDAFGLALEGGVWVCEPEAGIRRYRKGKPVSDLIPWPGGLAQSWMAFEDAEKGLWIATLAHGLKRKSTAGSWSQYGATNGLSSDALRTIFKDSEGNFWIGTDGGGINRMRTRRFRMVSTNPSQPAGITPCVAEDRSGTLWFSVPGQGLLRGREREGFAVISAPLPTLPASVWTLLPCRDGSLWLEDGFRGLLQRSNGVWNRFPNPAPARTYLRSMFEDSRGRLWLGDLEGISVFEGGLFTRINHVLGIAALDVRAFAEGTDGTIYAGSNGEGLLCNRSNVWTRITKREGLPSNRIWSLLTTRDGTLWIGTFGGGLCYLKNGIIHQLGGERGVPVSVITSIVEDDLEQLWFGTIRMGVVMAPLKNLYAYGDGVLPRLEVSEFDRHDGLITLECSGGSQPAAWKAADGKLWFATIEGPMVVDPKTLNRDPRPPRVWIEGVTVDQAKISVGSQDRQALAFPHSKALAVIPPGSRYLEISFTAPSLAASEKVRFRYRFEGRDSDWVDIGNRRVVTFSRLPHGNYNFHVMASNGDGVWNRQGAELRLQVLPYFWQTGLFKLLCGAVLASGIVALSRLILMKRYGRRLQLMEQKNALATERARIARDIHDQLGANLTRLALLSELAEADKHEPNKLTAHTGKLSSTVRSTVQALDEIVWAVNPRNDTMESLAAYLTHFVSEFFEGTDVRCRLDIPPQFPARTLAPNLRHNVLLVVREALNNVVRHARATEIQVVIHDVNGAFEIALSDNGVGFEKKRSRPARGGNGLGNMQERVEQFGGNFSCESHPGRGTRVRISFPFEARVSPEGGRGGS